MAPTVTSEVPVHQYVQVPGTERLESKGGHATRCNHVPCHDISEGMGPLTMQGPGPLANPTAAASAPGGRCQVPKEHPNDRHIKGDARPEGVTSVAAASLAETMQVPKEASQQPPHLQEKMRVLKVIRPVTSELLGSRNRPSHI